MSNTHYIVHINRSGQEFDLTVDKTPGHVVVFDADSKEDTAAMVEAVVREIRTAGFDVDTTLPHWREVLIGLIMADEFSVRERRINGRYLEVTAVSVELTDQALIVEPDRDLRVAFDAGDRINRDCLRHDGLPQPKRTVVSSSGMRPSSKAATALKMISACGGQPARVGDGDTSVGTKAPRKSTVVQKRGGGYYKDDGPGDDIPDNLDEIPDAEPRLEPLHRFANRPYVVLGKSYTPDTALRPLRQRGIGSWYGKKFHGQKTSIGEPYDMFAMTAAHPTLAIPSYVRVSNVANGKSVVVRVTDRGPFHADRVIERCRQQAAF